MTDDLVDDRSSTDWQINDSNTTVWREDVRSPSNADGTTYPMVVTSWNTRIGDVMPLYGDYEAALISIDPPISDTRPWTDVHSFLAGISQQIDDRSIWVGTYPAPGIPHQGDLWWNSTDGNLYIYYQDINSAAWVPANAMSGVYLPLSGGTVVGDVTVSGKLSVTGTFNLPFLIRTTNLWEDDAGDIRFKSGLPLDHLDGALAFGGGEALTVAENALAVANAAQVDADAAQVAADAANTTAGAAQITANNALPKAGGTMTGPIVLAGPPAAPLNPATKTYTDTADAANAASAATADSKAVTAQTAAATADAKAVAAQNTANTANTTANAAMPKAGGTFTGAVTMSGNASASLQPVTLQQLNAALAGIVAVTSGPTPPGSPADNALWFNSEDGVLYIRYNDGNSTAWVPTKPGTY